MWYYETQKQIIGPVSQSELISHASNGSISVETLVWQEGMAGWQKLSSTQLMELLPANSTPPSYQQKTFSPQSDPIKADLSTLKWLFISFLVGIAITLLMLISYPLLVSRVIEGNQATILVFSSVYSFLNIGYYVAVVLGLILLYKFWKLVQDGNARTTPGKAIGFIFIPVFNIYWIFVAFWGLSKEFNRYISSHFNAEQAVRVRKAKPALSLIVVLAPILITILTIAFVIILTSIISTHSPDIASQDPLKFFQLFIFPIIGAYAVQVVLAGAVFIDYYRTACSILNAEVTNQTK